MQNIQIELILNNVARIKLFLLKAIIIKRICSKFVLNLQKGFSIKCQ